MATDPTCYVITAVELREAILAGAIVFYVLVFSVWLLGVDWFEVVDRVRGWRRRHRLAAIRAGRKS